MTHTVGHRLGAAVALSHTSAALAHGLALWEPDLSLVHVTRLDGGAGRTEAGVQHHEGLCLEGDVEERHGYLVVRAIRAALEAASLSSTEGAVVILDSLLHQGHCPDEVMAAFAQYGRLLRDGEEPGDAVFREKLREDALRETTEWSMVRLVWSDLYRPAVTAARLRRMMWLHAA
jgi:hypothetical protein